MTRPAVVEAASVGLARLRAGRAVETSAVPWRGVLAWAVVGWLLGLGFVALDYLATVDQRGPLVVTEPIIPAAPVLEADLGPEAVNRNGPHDGAFFYVIARQPMHLDAASEGLDRPRYRLQRILFPVLGWALHPSGGGEGLVVALAVVGAVGVLAAAVSVGGLSTSLGGPAWAGAVVPLLSGCTTSLRITTPDPLAAGLAFLAVLAALHRRSALAVVLGVSAVLTKETSLLVLVGFALWQGGRRSVPLVAVPAAAAAAWWLVLRVAVPASGPQVIELTTPFRGWWVSAQYWAEGREPMGMVWFVGALVIGLRALQVGRLRHPLGWVVATQLLLLVPLIASALAPERSAGRTTLPLVMAAIVVLVAPRPEVPALAGDADLVAPPA